LSKTTVDERALKSLAEFVLKDLGLANKAELSIALVTEEQIKELNFKYRGINEATDVLAFNLADEEGFDGEIIISPAMAAREAEEDKLPLIFVIKKLLVHGILHLAGYSHKQPEVAEEMFSKQKQLLEKYAELKE